jgi:TPR repeat protein
MLADLAASSSPVGFDPGSVYSPPPGSRDTDLPAPASLPEREPGLASAASAAKTLPAPDPSDGRAGGAVPALLKRGHEMLDLRDVMAARLLFERAAALAPENTSAAVAAGETYDPNVLKELGARVLTPAPDRAARWYEIAKALGDREADNRLRQLRASAINGPETTTLGSDKAPR